MIMIIIIIDEVGDRATNIETGMKGIADCRWAA